MRRYGVADHIGIYKLTHTLKEEADKIILKLTRLYHFVPIVIHMPKGDEAFELKLKHLWSLLVVNCINAIAFLEALLPS